MTSKLLAKFGVWITRKFGGEVFIPKGTVLKVEIINTTPPPQKWRTVTCFAGFPEKTVYGGPYSSREFAVIAAKIAAVQLGNYIVPYGITVELVPPEETE